ncbi:TonB-linked outer membrane protein, SusC/RagA family [Sinomicrobium oceani]|uniref:TonB-linked outer membrane protein, SusC/RagA family n=1 Tax=Sinomicrobium oceani TaxID=1150368 RepID=A0A1K1QTG5_9FLAO|nr:TonB-dependent receptor [Sinomicrobium oceani]SFW62988.1 TonB-linked outer membrane protein, SusC/RagA family [Sinomicrobium oceani]
MKINYLRMKISLLLLFFVVLQITASSAPAQKKLVFDLQNVTLNEVLEEIKKQTDYKFFFEREVIDLSERISLKAERETVEIILERLFRGSPVTFTIIDRQIVLTKKIAFAPQPVYHAEMPVQRVITGTITDSSGIPLMGVTILVEGTRTGTTTDENGKYAIAAAGGDTLLFSYIGFASQSVKITAVDTTVNIALTEEVNSLEEVEVSVAFGKQKRISVVGAQTSVNVEELQQPVSNISTVLAGRVAGLTGVQRSGLPGYDGADIWIRGISTFTSAGNGPLILVDGVERSMNNIDPRDIASFTILKDASATAVYGVRGANGVVLIETKRGKIGKPSIQADYNEGISFFTKVPELADGITYMKLANEANTTRGLAPRYSQETIDRTASGEDPLLYPNVDWMDQVFKDFGRNRQVNVNVNGGAENAQYYVSLSYYDESGLFTTDGMENDDARTRFKRYNVTSNLTVDITPTTKVNLGVQGYISEGGYPGILGGEDDSARDVVNEIFNAAMQVPPVEYPVMYPGDFVPGISPNGDLKNPYALVTRSGYRTDTRNQIYSNLNITQELDFFTEGLSFNGMFAFDAYNAHNILRSKRESTYYVDIANPYNDDGSPNLQETYPGQNHLGYRRQNGGNRRFYIQASLDYNRTFGAHTLGGLLLFNRTDYVNAFAGDLTESIPFRNQGFAARVTYAYESKYFLELNGGYNGSENFAPDRRYGFFPSVAVGWVVSNEKFFEPISETINFLKIRYSDGKVGGASGAGRFAYLSKVEEDNDYGFDFGENVNFRNGIRETYQGVDVTWAESRKQDLGLELNAFNSKFKMTVDFFKEHTTGAFLQRQDIPNYIGLVSDPFGNIGETENKGVDGTVEYYTAIRDFNLSFRGTFSYNENKIIQNGQPEQPHTWLNRQGNPILGIYGLVAERLFTLEDDKDGDGYITTEDGFPSQYGQIQPGDVKYKDLNGDGQIDAYDRQLIGDGDVPRLTIGFGLGGDYKGFDASVFFQGQFHASRVISGNSIIPFNGDGGRGNLYDIAVNRWTPDNDDPYAMYPRLSFGASGIGQNNNTQESTWWLRKIDFLRLKSAEIGYTLPKTLTNKWHIGTTRFYLRGTNLLTFTKFKLWDPELNTSNGGAYPNISVCSLGVNLQF